MAKLYSITIKDDKANENVKKIGMYRKKNNLTLVHRNKLVNDGVIQVKTVDQLGGSDQQLAPEYNIKYEKEYFYRAIGPVIRFGQIFTLMPLSNVLSKNLNDIKFKWISIYTLGSVLSIVAGIFEFVLLLCYISNERLTITVVGDFLFYVTNITGQILLFKISMGWNMLLRQWYHYEMVFLKTPYKQLKYNLQFKVRLATFTILVLAVVEHVIWMVQRFYTGYKRKYECNYNETVFQIMNVYTKYQYFKIFGYNSILVVFSEWVYFILTISWTFIDVVILSLSIGLISRFQQINNRIKSVERQSVAEFFWVDVRRHYINLTELVNFVNNQIKFIVILSCSNNLYFVCQQIYNSVSYLPYLFNTIYFWLSLLFLCMRMFTVLFAAARINDVSIQSIQVMRQVPSHAWSIEAERFSEQLLNDCVALSGNKFFYITRRLIFAMVGSLITYEIVLLNHFDPSKLENEFCLKKLELIMHQG